MKGINVTDAPEQAATFMTINEIVEDLYAKLPHADLEFIKAMPREKLISFHSGPGRMIRNYYRLWQPDNPYIILDDPESPFFPDQVSQAAIEGLWETLQSE
jgi:hypothetical protein